ncbi:MAG: carcinine hydrolase/isopenicillin-N N-acyltransferase family protein [Candidatus Thorarchaeota archaeon]
MSDGCTIGAKRLGDRVVMFKNRDLLYRDFRDRVVFDGQMFGVVGVGVGSGQTLGISIGVNSDGLAACTATVLATSDTPYDVLVDEILRHDRSIDDALTTIQNRLDSGGCYQWCNIVLATPDEVGVIELGPDACRLQRDSTLVVRTNHHLLLPTGPLVEVASASERECAGPLSDSQRRYAVAERLAQQADAIEDFTAMLRTHSESRAFDSICRHDEASNSSIPYLGRTCYSYIVEMGLHTDHRPVMHVAHGNPCAAPYVRIDIDFSATESRRREILRLFP